ncbi:MAG: hypothetical protein HFJ38_07165 [Bacilli bacterium]|nr:hypothetical protein [Bacilli bacterium]
MNEKKYREKEWLRKYNLAKIYYEHYGNLNIPYDFKTKNGYTYNKEGEKIGHWIKVQRLAYNEKGRWKITKEQIILLNRIGMSFERYEEEWLRKYNLAKKYYEKNKNINIPPNFTTINGYKLEEEGINMGCWITNQRSAYIGKGNRKMTEQRIKMLENINICWFTKNKNKNLKLEEITEQNLKRKKIEILNRFYSFLNHFDQTSLPSKEEIEKTFIKKL